MPRGNPSRSPKLPVIDLHVHADAGILLPHIALQLCRRHPEQASLVDLFGPSMQRIITVPGSKENFLAKYELASRLIQTTEDLYFLIYEYLRACAERGVIYTELTLSPDQLCDDQPLLLSPTRQPGTIPIDYPTFLKAAVCAVEAAESDFGIHARLLMVLFRHFDPEKSLGKLQEWIANPHPLMVGINLTGDETKYPAELFTSHFALAKYAGLKCTAHLGETSSLNTTIEAIEILQPHRISHGLTLQHDPSMLAEYAFRGVGVEVCPSSNQLFGITHSLEEHPIMALCQHAPVALGTDYPAFTGQMVDDEYRALKGQFLLTDDQLRRFTDNAIDMAFCDLALKQSLRDQVVAYQLQVNMPSSLPAWIHYREPESIEEDLEGDLPMDEGLPNIQKMTLS